MPREAWRDEPEYVALWREARQKADEPGPGLVLSDWLFENGHNAEGWRERLRALAGVAPEVDGELARAHFIPIGHGKWRMLLAAPPPEDMLVVFRRNEYAYQYMRRFTGRCGWDVLAHDFPSAAERAHLLAIPRLEMFAAKMMTPEGWDWVTANLPNLTHLEADGAMIGPGRLARLRQMPRLQHLSLRGRAAGDTSAITSLPNLRHLALGPCSGSAGRFAELAPNAESVLADLDGLDGPARWPRLRSFRMLPQPGELRLGTAELLALARCPALEQLNARVGEVGPEALEALAAAPRLRDLTLRFEGVAVPSLAPLAGSAALELLAVEGPAGETHLADVARVPGLRSLSLPRVTFGKRGLAHLAGMRNLEELQLFGRWEGKKPPLALAELPRLTKLDLRQLSMGDGGPAAMYEATPPWVERLFSGGGRG